MEQPPRSHSILRLQVVEKAAARFLTGSKKRDHICPGLASLHRLPVKFRVNFEIPMFVYKVLSGCATRYIGDLIVCYCPAFNCATVLLRIKG